MGFLNEILVSFERIEADSGSCSSISDRKVKLIFTPLEKNGRPEDTLSKDFLTSKILESGLSGLSASGLPEIRVAEDLTRKCW